MTVLAGIQPTQLRAARIRAVANHPNTAESWADPTDAVLAELRQRVEAASGSPNLVMALAKSLSPRELRWLVTGLLQWPELRTVICAIIRASQRQSLCGVLWSAWQRNPLIVELTQLLLEHAGRFGWDKLVAPHYTNVVRKWVESGSPGRSIQQWLDNRGLSYSDISNIVDFPLRKDTPLLTLVRNAVLMYGSAAQLTTEGNLRLRSWLPELHPDERFLFCQNYLLRISYDDWDAYILKEIESSYGLPRRPRIERFWQPLPEVVKLAFQRFFIRRKLRTALADNERYEYWMRWADEMVDITLGHAGRTPYGFFDFGTFGVIEFFEYGNAGFFYPSESFKTFTSRGASHPSQLKQWMWLNGGWNRITRNGAWQLRADRMVKRWIAAYRR